MNESSKKRAVIVGSFVFIGLIFLLGGILMVGNLRETFKNKLLIVAHFDEVNGLKKGNNIWFSGVKVGIVNNLTFYGKSQVEVSMNIATMVKQYIRKDAKVRISSDGLIGNKILVIYGGTESAGEVTEGDTLGVEKTFSSEDMINTLQENNKNALAITNDLKILSSRLSAGEGTLGKLLIDNSIYENLNAATKSLKNTSAKAEELVGSLITFSSGLNKKGTLVNELTTDTIVFNTFKASVKQLRLMADTATQFITNLKQAASNPKTSVGVMLYDEESGTRLKETIKNLESSSQKLDEDLKAAQHSFLLKGYFKKKDKAATKTSPVK
jgi:phospholipid/cholesterol/gamma-HCH transport system substrate-binding protein